MNRVVRKGGRLWSLNSLCLRMLFLNPIYYIYFKKILPAIGSLDITEKRSLQLPAFIGDGISKKGLNLLDL